MENKSKRKSMGQLRVNNPQKTGRRQQITPLRNTANTTQQNEMMSNKDPINNHEGQHHSMDNIRQYPMV